MLKCDRPAYFCGVFEISVQDVLLLPGFCFSECRMSWLVFEGSGMHRRVPETGALNFYQVAFKFAGPTAQRRVRLSVTIHLSDELPISCYLFQILFTVSVRGAQTPRNVVCQ